jgi:hypothetical protein
VRIMEKCCKFYNQKFNEMKTCNHFNRVIKFLCIFVVTGLLLSGTAQLFAQVSLQEITGNWIMESNGDQFLGGNILFMEDGQYEFYKKYPDGSGAEVKGGFILDSENSPARLKLCLGDCNAPGSEWTTSFAIVRITPEGQLELFISPGGEYPDGFPADPDAPGMYVFVRFK